MSILLKKGPIALVTSDFRGSSYSNDTDCPLKRALVRLGYPVRSVGGNMHGKIHIRFLSNEIEDEYLIINPDTWDYDIADPLIRLANNGKPARRTLEILDVKH